MRGPGGRRQDRPHEPVSHSRGLLVDEVVSVGMAVRRASAVHDGMDFHGRRVKVRPETNKCVAFADYGAHVDHDGLVCVLHDTVVLVHVCMAARVVSQLFIETLIVLVCVIGGTEVDVS